MAHLGCMTLVCAALVVAGAAGAGFGALGAEPLTYTGCCDGSASAVVDEVFFAAASDEGSTIRLYRRGAGGAPVSEFKLGSFLGARHQREADIEGAARLGDLVFWIGSHSRKSDGTPHPGRQVFFATEIRAGEGVPRLVPVGRPFRGLLEALAKESRLVELDFAGAAKLGGEARGGLNIEGLAAGPGDSLWIGFRNPVPLGRAVLVPLLNPREVIEGRPARLGAALRIDLEGLGIRDIARVGDRYLIVGGPAQGGGRHRLFVWHGDDRSPEEIRKGIPHGFAAEGILVDDKAGTTTAELLSDEGTASVSGVPCERFPNPARQSFHGLTVHFGP